MNEIYPRAIYCSKYMLFGIKMPMLFVWFFTTGAIFAQNAQGQLLSDEQPIADTGYGRPPLADRPLKIGDAIPDELWNLPLEVVNHPDGKETIKLADYKGKLIILDFWATWCVPCIAAFPKSDSLQREFGDKVQVLLVNSKGTGDKREKVDFLLANRRNPDGNRYIMPSVANDTALKRTFPHKSIPHYAWISPDGMVMATTEPDQLTKQNVLAALHDPRHRMPSVREQVKIDASKAILDPREDLDTKPKRLMGILTDGKSGFPYSLGMIGDGDDYRKVYFLNQSLLSIVEKSLSRNPITDNRIFIYGGSLGDSILGIKLSDALYCYELDLKEPKPLDSLYAIARKDVETFAGIRAQLVDTLMEVWTVKLADITKVPHSKGGIPDNNLRDKGVTSKYINNQSIGALVNLLNQRWELPLLNETEYKEKIDLTLPSDIKDPDKLNKALNHQGFGIEKEQREIKVLMINKTDHSLI